MHIRSRQCTVSLLMESYHYLGLCPLFAYHVSSCLQRTGVLWPANCSTLKRNSAE